MVQELQNVGADVGYHVGDGIDCSMTTFENVPFHSKEPGSLKGLVKLWTICRVSVLPGLQMDSKADHDPHAN